MNGRVNGIFIIYKGVLAVTRSLGDLSMKEWVIGAAYTTETVLDTTNDKIIIACDGVLMQLIVDLGCLP